MPAENQDQGRDTRPPSANGHDDGVPNPETGVGIGAGAASSFEPEEDERDETGAPEAPGHNQAPTTSDG